MPGKLKVKILAAKNLPIMDRASDSTDAFVEVSYIYTSISMIEFIYFINVE